MMPRHPGDPVNMNDAYSCRRPLHGKQQQQKQQQQEAVFSSKQMLDAYIYDFFLKSSFKNSASTFCREAGMVGASGPAQAPSALDEIKDAPQGFLYEWWQIFWDLFNARTHKEGSAVAKEYSKILSDRQKQEYAYRSLAVQAARLQHMAEQSGEYPKDAMDPNFLLPGFSNGKMGNGYNTNMSRTSSSQESNPDPSNVSTTSFTPKNVPSTFSSNSSGWPVYANQSYQFSKSSSGMFPSNMSHQYNPPISVPSPTPQSVTSKNKLPRTTSVKNKSIPTNEASRSPCNSTTPNGVFTGPMSNFAGKISGIEGLHNYQRQMIKSEIEYNNQNKKTSPHSATNLNGGSKNKYMLPPSAGISPHSLPPVSSVPNMNLVNASKPKMARRKSANHVLGPVSKSMQNSSSDSPSTPINVANINVNGTVSGTDGSSKIILPNSLSTVAEINKAPVNDFTDMAKKSTKKVRKGKKPQSITFNNNNFNFVTSNTVPTPPNDLQSKSQFRILNKNQTKKGASIRSNNNKVMKSSSEASPQLLQDDSSITTPTFVNTVWNANGKVQTTPHANFTFVGENSALSGTNHGFTNGDSTMGSSSGASYQYSEADADDLLSMNTMLPINDVPTIKNEIPSAEVIPNNDPVDNNHDTTHQEFNLDLLKPSEHSFSFLSWRQ